MHPLTVRWCSIFHAGPLRGPGHSITILNLTVFMIIPLSYCYSYCTLWLSVSAAVVWPPPAEEQTVMLCEKIAVNCDFHSSFFVWKRGKSPNAIIPLPLRATNLWSASSYPPSPPSAALTPPPRLRPSPLLRFH